MKKEEKLAAKIIKEMQLERISPDQMLKILKLAKEKFKKNYEKT